jgi:tetratricopeptide (TPR) repeat protein
MIVGTPGYMSPEQARGEREIDARADVFSLGGVLFKCLTGQPAFGGESVVAQLAKILFSEAPHVRELRPDVPPLFADVIARMLSKEPARRQASASALVGELAQVPEVGPEEEARAPISVREPHITTGEQRLVSIVLAAVEDIVLAADSTVKEQWNTLDAKRQRLREAALPFGAQVEALANGAVIATLQGRGAATDQAAHAARCALAMRATAADVRIALATTYGELGEGVVRPSVGDVIDRAAELLRHAQPQETMASSKSTAQPSARIRVDDVTAGLLDVRFDVSTPTQTRDGSSPPVGTELRGERGGLDVARTLLGKATSCVGRERELASLRSLFDEVVSEPVARCVLMTGPAGIGKSRVRYEFARGLAKGDSRAQVWVSRGDPMAAGSPFAMLAQVLRSAIGLAGGEPLDLAQRKIRARVAWRVSPDGAERVAEFLGELLDVPFDDGKSVQLRAARQDAILMGDQMRRAFEDFIAAECSASGVVIVLEDLHWGDLPTVKFIDAALRNCADARLMVLALARPEVHETFPKLWAERGLQEMRLGELTRRAASILVREALGDGVTEEQVKLILERAAGNAFYLEEIIRSFASGRGEALPDTVLAMLQTRLEGLPAEARRVLRAASVFGEVFWSGGVGALAGGGPDVKQWLGELAGWELATRRIASRFSGEEEYVFRHALVRDAAYSMLLPEDCALGHRLAGDWLARIGETNFATIAEHYERGGKPVRARRWYARAAAQALEGNDFVAAIRMADRATRAGIRDSGAGSSTGRQTIEQTTASGKSSRPPPPPATIAADELGELRLLAAEAHGWRGEFAEARTAGLEAMELLSRGSTRWCAAAGEVALATSRLGDYALLARILELLRGLENAERVGVPYVIASARAAQHLLAAGEISLVDAVLEHLDELVQRMNLSDHSALAWLAFVRSLRSDPAASMELTEAAIEHFEKAGDLRSAAVARGNLGDANVQMGTYAEAEILLKDALANAERMSLSNVASLARVNLGFCVGRLGRTDEALTHVRLGATEMHAQGDVRREACAWLYAATIQLGSGRVAEARDDIAHALPLVVGTPPMRAWTLGLEAEIELAEGRPADALSSARQAMELLEQMGFLDEGESTVRLAWALALRASGDETGFQTAVREARESLLKRATAIKNERRRRSFLENVPENARTLELAAQLA